MSADDAETLRLLNLVLNLATDERAPVRAMPPMTVMVSSLANAGAHRHDADALLATLVGALAWMARDHWTEVAREVREAEGSALQ